MNARLLLLCGVFMAALAAPAWADDGWGDGIEVMSAEDLDAHRGGFEIAGLNINFGATITTLVNGVPALTTVLTWTDVGAFVQETVGSIGQHRQIGGKLARVQPDAADKVGIVQPVNVGWVDSLSSRQRQQVRA